MVGSRRKSVRASTILFYHFYCASHVLRLRTERQMLCKVGRLEEGMWRRKGKTGPSLILCCFGNVPQGYWRAYHVAYPSIWEREVLLLAWLLLSNTVRAAQSWVLRDSSTMFAPQCFTSIFFLSLNVLFHRVHVSLSCTSFLLSRLLLVLAEVGIRQTFPFELFSSFLARNCLSIWLSLIFLN